MARLLERFRPDVHCKAADYAADSLPEAEVVRRHGGRIEILPLSSGYSTSQLVGQAAQDSRRPPGAPALSPQSVGSNELESQGGTVCSQTAAARPISTSASACLECLLSAANDHRQLAYKLAGPLARAVEAIRRAQRQGGFIVFLAASPSAMTALQLVFGDIDMPMLGPDNTWLGDSPNHEPAAAVMAGRFESPLAAEMLIEPFSRQPLIFLPLTARSTKKRPDAVRLESDGDDLAAATAELIILKALLAVLEVR